MTSDMSRMRLHCRLVKGLLVVGVPAEIDFRNAQDVRDAVVSLVGEHGVLAVDLRGNEYCDSSGMAALVHAGRAAQRSGGEVRLVMDDAATRRIFKVTGIDRRFRIFDSATEAATASPSASSLL
jgi:anti-sigma B factor antagonist